MYQGIAVSVIFLLHVNSSETVRQYIDKILREFNFRPSVFLKTYKLSLSSKPSDISHKNSPSIGVYGNYDCAQAIIS